MNHLPAHTDPAQPQICSSHTRSVIEVYGFLNSAIGLGETARLMVRALRAAGCPVRAMAVPLKGRARVDFTAEELPDHQPSAEAVVRIVHLNPEHLPEFIPHVPENFFTSARSVIVPYWETETIPESAKACACYFDEVWCSTRFLAESFGRGLGLPTRVFPAPLESPSVSDDGGDSAGFAFGSRHVFLFSFDYHSCFKRKNPDGLCEAFTRAFPTEEPGGPILLVKSIHGREHFHQDAYLRAKFARRRDILFLDGYLSTAERTALFDRCDTYVSLHRSEGLGMTILEAMAQGKPCIATAYSGNLDFTLETHSHPIPFRKAIIGPGSIHYPEGEEWAEPDLDAAARAMRACYENPDASRDLGAKAQAWILENHCFEKTGTILVGLIRNLMAQSPDTLPKKQTLVAARTTQEVDHPNHAAIAYASLKQARQNIKEIEALVEAIPKKQKELGKICRRLAQNQKLLATAISNSLKLNKEVGVRDQRVARIKECYEEMLLRVMVENMDK